MLDKMTSKLEVSIKENKIKDEFISKVLMSRTEHLKEKEEITLIKETLKHYL